MQQWKNTFHIPYYRKFTPSLGICIISTTHTPTHSPKPDRLGLLISSPQTPSPFHFPPPFVFHLGNCGPAVQHLITLEKKRGNRATASFRWGKGKAGKTTAATTGHNLIFSSFPSNEMWPAKGKKPTKVEGPPPRHSRFEALFSGQICETVCFRVLKMQMHRMNIQQELVCVFGKWNQTKSDWRKFALKENKGRIRRMISEQ